MNPRTTQIERFAFNADELIIQWRDGRRSELAAIWLRDHCQMPQSRDPRSGQRLLNITDIAPQIRIEAVTQGDEALIVDFAPQAHRSVFPLEWLRANCYCLNTSIDDRSEASKRLWRGDSFAGGLPWFEHDAFCEDRSVRRAALCSVRDDGFALLRNVPCEPGRVLAVIAQFGFVRETNYGALFDVRSRVDANNLAFTNLALGCHLDNPYRDPVPGLQLLHCLHSSTSGGETILQDGFMAAKVLRDEHPGHFATLVRQRIDYRFADKDADLRARVPMIEVNDRDEIVKVRYNNRSISTLLIEPSRMRAFYDAYRAFAGILEREDLQLSFKLDPGDLMLFDNTRVLHARKAFAGGGSRHLQGAYSDLDGLYSALNRLTASAID